LTGFTGLGITYKIKGTRNLIAEKNETSCPLKSFYFLSSCHYKNEKTLSNENKID